MLKVDGNLPEAVLPDVGTIVPVFPRSAWGSVPLLRPVREWQSVLEPISDELTGGILLFSENENAAGVGQEERVVLGLGLAKTSVEVESAGE